MDSPAQAQVKLKLVTEETYAHSRAFIFVLDQYVKLLKIGFADLELPFGNKTTVTYALNNADEVIAATVWSYDESKRSAWEIFSAVAEEHRRQGVYKQLFAEVERRAKMKRAVALYSTIAVANEPIIAATAAKGSSPSWYKTKKDLR